MCDGGALSPTSNVIHHDVQGHYWQVMGACLGGVHSMLRQARVLQGGCGQCRALALPQPQVHSLHPAQFRIVL